MEVSMILIRLEDKEGDTTVDEQTTANLSPAYVCSPENPLHQKSCNQVIRISMRLQEGSKEFVYVENMKRESSATEENIHTEAMGNEASYAFTYCLRPLRNRKIMEAATAMQLRDLVSPVRSPMDLVEGDLSLRSKSEERVLRGDVKRPLLSTAVGDGELKACASLALTKAVQRTCQPKQLALI